jgi:hypothetical protein
MLPLRKINIVNLEEYNPIVFGGGVYASKINGYKKFHRNIVNLKDKKIIVYACGVSSEKGEDNHSILDLNFKNNQTIKYFYLRGGFNYRSLKLSRKIHFLYIRSFLNFKKYLLPEEIRVLEEYKKPLDYTKIENINKIIEYIKK